MDIKAPLIKERYGQATGVDIICKELKQAIELIKNSGLDYEFRTTLVPGIHTPEDVVCHS